MIRNRIRQWLGITELADEIRSVRVSQDVCTTKTFPALAKQNGTVNLALGRILAKVDPHYATSPDEARAESDRIGDRIMKRLLDEEAELRKYGGTR